MTWLIIGIVCFLLGTLLAIYISIFKEDDGFPMTMAVWVLMGLMTLTFISHVRSQGYNSKYYTIETEVQQKYINGSVVKSDTLYMIKKK